MIRKIITYFILTSLIVSCGLDNQDPDRFKTGVFEIPEGKGYEKTIIVRSDSLQIETYEDKVDTLRIVWENNFNYTLEMLHPKNEIDNEPIHVKITRLKRNSYEFEAVIGHSNFVQKGTLKKLSD